MSALPRALALAGPALVVGVWVAASGIAAPPRPYADDPAMARVHARYAANPSVMVIGNSQAHSAVDPDQLAALLHLPDEPQLATVGGALGAIAYVTLAHQVLPHGTPKLVVVAMTLDQLLDTAPPADGFARAWFERQLTHPDDALDSKVFGATWPAWRRAVDTTGALRDAALSALTALPLRLLGEADAPGRMAAARTAVLGELGGAQFAARVSVMPLGSAARAPDRAEIDLDATLLPDMARAAADAGTQLLFVTLPVQNPAGRADPALVRRVAAWAQQHGAGLLHLEGVAISSDGWLDGAHMNARGQEQLTEALGTALAALGGPGHLQAPPLPLGRPTLTQRDLPPPPTPGAPEATSPCHWRVPLTGASGVSDVTVFSHGLGFVSPLRLFSGRHELTPHSNLRGDDCVDGFFHAEDGLWVAPARDAAPADLRVAWAGPPDDSGAAWVIGGSTLELAWADAPALPADATVRVVAQGFGDQDQAPVLTVGAAAVPLQRWGDLWIGSAPAGHAEGPWKVAVRAQPGADVLLTAVVLHAGLDQWLLGQPTATRLDVAGAAGVVSAPALAPVEITTTTASDRALRFVLPAPWSLLDDDDLAALGDRRIRACHPLEAFGPAGQRLGPETLTVDQGVATTTIPEAMSPDGTWTLRQRPVRDCKHHTLVAPGETVTLTARSPRALPVAVDRLTLTTTTLPPGRAGAQIGLTADGAEVLAPAPAEARSWALSPVGPHPARVALSVTAPADAWVAVGAGALEAGAPPAFAQPGGQLAPTAPINASLPALLADKRLYKLPASAELTPQGDTFTLRGAADTTPAVCVTSPAGAGAVSVTFTPTQEVSVTLGARWENAAGDPVGKPAQVRQVVPASGGTVTLPLDARDGATTVHVCLWRARVAADLHVTGWNMTLAP